MQQSNHPEWLPIASAPRDGTVIELRFGEDGHMPGWWHEFDFDGIRSYPWAFFDKGCDERTFVNHAVDSAAGGPSHWRAYRPATAAPAAGDAVAVPTSDQIERHAIKAGECPAQSRVMLVSSIERLQKRDAPAVPKKVD